MVRRKRVEQMRVIYLDAMTCTRWGGCCRVFSVRGFSLDEIPVVPIYSNRRGMLRSTTLLDIANLNITHYQQS